MIWLKGIKGPLCCTSKDPRYHLFGVGAAPVQRENQTVLNEQTTSLESFIFLFVFKLNLLFAEEL